VRRDTGAASLLVNSSNFRSSIDPFFLSSLIARFTTTGLNHAGHARHNQRGGPRPCRCPTGRSSGVRRRSRATARRTGRPCFDDPWTRPTIHTTTSSVRFDLHTASRAARFPTRSASARIQHGSRFLPIRHVHLHPTLIPAQCLQFSSSCVNISLRVRSEGWKNRINSCTLDTVMDHNSRARKCTDEDSSARKGLA